VPSRPSSARTPAGSRRRGRIRDAARGPDAPNGPSARERANGADGDGAAPTAPLPALLDALRAIGRELRLAERDAMDRLGLPPAQAHVLRHLGERPARSLTEMAERTHTDPSSASVVVRRLVERGLVARRPAAGDRRRTELALTAAGRALLRRLPASAADRLAAAVTALGDRQTASLARGLRALARALDAAPDGGVDAASDGAPR
jgi:DNA-binding MarR family transcriptional regulator